MKQPKGYLSQRAASFGYAFKGIRILFTSQAHAKIHFLFTVLTAGLGFYFEVSAGEWVALLLCMAMVWVAEGINTAIEFLTDLASPEHHPLAGKVKDVAAGAVLLASIFAALIGSVIFYPHVKLLF